MSTYTIDDVSDFYSGEKLTSGSTSAVDQIFFQGTAEP